MAYTECMKSELDLFRPRNIQTNILKTEEVLYRPISSLDNQSVIEFVCNGNSDSYIDLSSIHLRIKMQLLKSDGKIMTKDNTTTGTGADKTSTQGGVINNMLHSLFRNVSVSFNNKIITSNDGNYAYRSYIETILNYGNDASNTHLELAGWYNDKTSKNLDSLKDLEGLTKRKALVANSNIVELYDKVHVDVFKQEVLLINNVDVRLTFTLNKPEFYILNDNVADDSIFKILEATLYVNYCTLNPSVLIAHHKMLDFETAKYHYKRCEIKTFTIGTKGNTYNLDNVVLGLLPTNLIFMMVDNDAYTGLKKKNPFNFKSNKITQCELFVNGKAHPSSSIIDNTEYVRAYAALFSASGLLHTPHSNTVTKEMFDHGFFMISYNLTPDLSTGGACSSLEEHGNIRLDTRFESNLVAPVTCIVYMEFNSTIKIDKNRNVFIDF